MTMTAQDLYAALMHELKNSLGLLAMTMDRIPHIDSEAHDRPLDESRLMCQQVVERLRQSLLLYKAANHSLPMSIDAYSPHEFLREVGDEARSLARGRVAVEVAVDAAVPPLWFFDRNLVDIAISNAIHNSLVYARSRIDIRADLTDGMLSLTVADDSAGFPAHILESLATGAPFSSGGTGLGLRLAEMIAEAHANKGRAGLLRLSNEPGATFRLLLP
ncbi:sensor histidine kinase [Parasulfuritortus cantonensis]|uniref:histidine kinase n=1 Tax=Parasulfuritortus cantonensis TaxID=2528202 RepID=A0A4R1BR58_9PROT|nr:sensor histidine kinase [Parasulfuritortus cantonensis]TCJ19787.1 sensor histidine kinase [Parasulfuritortus cantonensis]